jgi:hypothetical protein
MVWFSKNADKTATILGAAFSGIGLIITYTPAKAAEGLFAWKEPAFVAAFVLFVFAAFRFTYSAGKKSVRSDRVIKRNKLIYAANQIHTLILSYGEYYDISVTPLVVQLNDACSAWDDDDARIARNEYLEWVRKARAVRNVTSGGSYLGRDFRNEIERNEYDLYLTNARDRLVAALNHRTMPPRFDPFDDNRV